MGFDFFFIFHSGLSGGLHVFQFSMLSQSRDEYIFFFSKKKLRARLVQLHESNEVQCNVMQWMVIQYLLPCVCLVSLKSDRIAIIILNIKSYAIANLPLS